MYKSTQYKDYQNDMISGSLFLDDIKDQTDKTYGYQDYDDDVLIMEA